MLSETWTLKLIVGVEGTVILKDRLVESYLQYTPYHQMCDLSIPLSFAMHLNSSSLIRRPTPKCLSGENPQVDLANKNLEKEL